MCYGKHWKAIVIYLSVTYRLHNTTGLNGDRRNTRKSISYYHTYHWPNTLITMKKATDVHNHANNSSSFTEYGLDNIESNSDTLWNTKTSNYANFHDGFIGYIEFANIAVVSDMIYCLIVIIVVVSDATLLLLSLHNATNDMVFPIRPRRQMIPVTEAMIVPFGNCDVRSCVQAVVVPPHIGVVEKHHLPQLSGSFADIHLHCYHNKLRI